MLRAGNTLTASPSIYFVHHVQHGSGVVPTVRRRGKIEWPLGARRKSAVVRRLGQGAKCTPELSRRTLGAHISSHAPLGSVLSIEGLANCSRLANGLGACRGVVPQRVFTQISTCRGVCHCRLHRLSTADSDMGDDMGSMGPGHGGGMGADSSLTGAARRATRLQLPGMGRSNTRSLFIFSEDNFIRKYAQIIIEWGYPFCYGTPAMFLCSVCRVKSHLVIC